MINKKYSNLISLDKKSQTAMIKQQKKLIRVFIHKECATNYILNFTGNEH